MKDEIISDDVFLDHLYILSVVLKPAIANERDFLNKMEKRCKDMNLTNDFIINDLPNMDGIKDKLQLPKRSNNLALYSLFHIMQLESEVFEALFWEKPIEKEVSYHPELFENVLVLEFDADKVDMDDSNTVEWLKTQNIQ